MNFYAFNIWKNTLFIKYYFIVNERNVFHAACKIIKLNLTWTSNGCQRYTIVSNPIVMQFCMFYMENRVYTLRDGFVIRDFFTLSVSIIGFFFFLIFSVSHFTYIVAYNIVIFHSLYCYCITMREKITDIIWGSNEIWT